MASAKPLMRLARDVWYLDRYAAFQSSHHYRLSGYEINELHKAILTEDPPSMIIQGIQAICKLLEVSMTSPTTWMVGPTEVDVPLVQNPYCLKSWLLTGERF